MREYLEKIYKTRYFWSHLAKNDLKARFRRSKLGILWLVLQPFFLTIIMAIVFSTIFRQELGEYALYILSGIVVWDLLTNSIIGGGSSIFGSEQYIRQFSHPITIYTLKYALLNTVTFTIELLALVLWVVIMKPINLILAVWTVPLTVVIYFAIAWALTTIAGYSNTKYRDYPQIMALVMQAIWYVSPVFFKPELFLSNPVLSVWFQWNPITHVLNLVRDPFVNGQMPSPISYLYVLGLIAALGFWAYCVNKKNEKKIIFYF